MCLSTYLYQTKYEYFPFISMRISISENNAIDPVYASFGRLFGDDGWGFRLRVGMQGEIWMLYGPKHILNVKARQQGEVCQRLR